MTTLNFFKTLGITFAFALVFCLYACSDDDEDKPKEASLFLEYPDGSIPPLKLRLGSQGGEQEYNIISNGTWKITKIGDWATVSPDTGAQNGEIKIAVDENKDLEDRELTLSFAVDGTEQVTTYNIFQLGYGAKISVTLESGSPVSKAGGDIVFAIVTNSDEWQYSIDDDAASWLTSKLQTTNGLILAAAKNTEEARSATITFRLKDYPSVYQEIQLVQEKGLGGTITLNKPAANFIVDLSLNKDIDFEWESTEISGGYKIVISHLSDLSSIDYSQDLTTENMGITAEDLDIKLKELGVPLGIPIDLYWSIQPLDANDWVKESVEIRKATVTRKTTTPVVADMLDIEFNLDKTAKDVSVMNLTVENKTFDYPFTVAYNSTYNRNVAKFNPKENSVNPGASKGSYYRIDYKEQSVFKEKLADGHSFECLVQFDIDYSGKNIANETKFFSTHAGGGTGFMLTKSSQSGCPNELTFLPNVSNTEGGAGVWRIVNAKMLPDGQSWYHMVGVWDKALGKADVYINGELKNTLHFSGFYKTVSSAVYEWVAIGGDAGNNVVENPFKGSLAIARIYDKPLNRIEAEYLWNQVMP